MIVLPEGTEGLIFDLDGTLADTMGMHIESWELAGQFFGAEITAKMINDYAGIPTLQLIELFNKEYGWSLDPIEFRKEKNKLYLDIKAKSGGIKAIQHMVDYAESQRGIRPMAIGTGSIRTNAIYAVDALGIADWFVTLITADDVINPKPHPETFEKGAEAMGLSPTVCHVFEDSNIGIKAALDGGMSCSHIVTGKNFDNKGKLL